MFRHTGLLGLILAASFIVFGCGGDDNPVAPAGNSETGDYLKSLPPWEEFSPYQEYAVADTDTSTACLDQVGDQRLLCVETPKSLTNTPDELITYNPAASVLWPGALIQGRTYVNGLGTMRELPIRQRAPVTLSIDILDQNNTRTVENPTVATVGSAVGELISAANALPTEFGSSVSYRKTEAYSLDQLSVNLGLSVKYLGGNARADLSYDSTTEQNTVAAYFVQRLFTVSIVQPQTPDAVFSSAFTADRLQEQIDLEYIGPDNLPVYVSQVVYGRMLIMTMTSTHSTREMKAALTASYNAIEGNTQVEDTSVLEDSDFTVAAIGGDTAGILNLCRTGNLADYFAATIDLIEAAPISYTLLNLADNSTASVAETTEYTERICSSVEVHLLDDEAQWRGAVQGEEGDVIYTFVPNGLSISQSEEVDWTPTGDNRGLGTPTLTFLGANTGYPFDFVIDKSMTPGNFTWNDNDDDFWGNHRFDDCPYPLLSPGDMHDYEDDDFSVTITRVDEGLEISGIAVNVGNNGLEPTEYLEVYDPNNILLEIFDNEDPLPADSGYRFMGIASPLPLKKIYFNEDIGGDDICFQNVWISVRTTGDGGDE